MERDLFPTKMLRSSLALGPGEVGAPVFDLNGNFIGITHAALPDLNLHFYFLQKPVKELEMICYFLVRLNMVGLVLQPPVNLMIPTHL